MATPLSIHSASNLAETTQIDDASFHADVAYIEALWRRTPIGQIDMPLIDVGPSEDSARGNLVPVVFVPILEHLEFVYARQIRTLSQSRRVILYRRQESRHRPVGLRERADELRMVLDSLGFGDTIHQDSTDLGGAMHRAPTGVDLVGHGDAAMVLFEFAVQYPQYCHSLTIIAQGADYEIAPHPFIWLLHELFVRLPVERLLPAWFLRRIVINYIMAQKGDQGQSQGSYDEGARATIKAQEPHPSPRATIKAHSTPPRHPRPYGPAMLDEGSRASATMIRGLPRHLIEEQFKKIALWPSVYRFSVLPLIHGFDMRKRLQRLTMPIFLINRADDVLSPEVKTRWLAEQLPNCAGYCVVPGGERFFLYSQAELVTPLIEAFLSP